MIFLNLSVILPINDEVSEGIIKIRKQYQIKIPDSILAATAIENAMTLLTRNEKDFNRVNELKVLNPFNV